jgi:hypothetical protein
MMVLEDVTMNQAGRAVDSREPLVIRRFLVIHRLGVLHLGALLCFVGLSLADMASTMVALQRGLMEGNFLPSMILAAGGESLMYGFKLLVVSLVVAVVLRLTSSYPRLWYGLYTGNAIMAIVVLGNLATMVEAGVL